MADAHVAGIVIEREAGAAVSGHRCVVVRDDSTVVYGDNTNSDHRNRIKGVTRGAASLAATAVVQTYGPLSEVTWSWTPGLPIYYSTGGALTQTAPTSGAVQQIAIAETATKIFINPQPPIILS